MRVLLQRCYEASVSMEDEVISEIAGGLCLLVGFTHTDTRNRGLYGKKNRGITNL